MLQLGLLTALGETEEKAVAVLGCKDGRNASWVPAACPQSHHPFSAALGRPCVLSQAEPERSVLLRHACLPCCFQLPSASLPVTGDIFELLLVQKKVFSRFS